MIFLSTFLKIALLPYFTMFVKIPTTFKIFLIDGIMPNQFIGGQSLATSINRANYIYIDFQRFANQAMAILTSGAFEAPSVLTSQNMSVLLFRSCFVFCIGGKQAGRNNNQKILLDKSSTQYSSHYFKMSKMLKKWQNLFFPNTRLHLQYRTQMLKKNLLIIILAIITTTWVVEGRLQLKTISLNLFRRDGSWTYIDRVHLDPGHMSVRSTVKLILDNVKQGAVYDLQLAAIPQQIWQKSLQAKCNQQAFNAEELQIKRRKEVTFDFRLEASNIYSATVSSTLEVPSEQSYHFVLRDCSKVLVNDGYGREAKIDFSLDMRNNDRHVCAGEDQYGWLLPVLMASGLGMLWFLGREKEEEGDNWIKVLVKISLWLGLGSILFKYIGYLVYAHVNGVEHGFFDFLYLLLHSSSDSLLLVLVTLLSYGWTVTFKNTQDFDMYVPLAAMLGLVNIIMTMLNKVSDGEHDKYHMFDSIPAYIMLGFRAVALIAYLVGICQSWAESSKTKTPQKLKKYLYQLTILGFIYMTFVPIGFVGVRYVSNRYKKETMFFAMELVRLGLTGWLVWLAGCKRSAYRAIIDGSFMEKGEKFY